MERPSWAMKYKKEHQQVPDQITVMPGRPAWGPQQGSMSIIGAGPAPKVDFTGAGDNGVVEPQKPVDMVITDGGPRMIHEGEIKIMGPGGKMTVIAAKDIPQQILAQLERSTGMKGYAEGTGNYVNPINSVSGVPDFVKDATNKSDAAVQSGTTTSGTSGSNPIDVNNLGNNRDLVMNTIKADIPVTQGGTPIGYTDGTGGVKKDPLSVNFSVPGTKDSIVPISPIVTPSVPTINITPPVATQMKDPIAPTITPAVKPTVNVTAPVSTQMKDPIAPTVTPAVTPTINVTPPVVTQAKDPIAPIVTSAADTQGETVTAQTGPNYQQNIDTAYQRIVDVMNGMSPTDKLIADRLLANFDASNAASTQASIAKISSNPNMTDAAKRRLMFELERTGAAERSNLLGDINVSQSKNAQEAAKSVFEMGNTQISNLRTRAQEDWTRELLYNDPTTPEGLSKLQAAYQKFFPGSTAPDMNELIRQRQVAAEKDKDILLDADRKRAQEDWTRELMYNDPTTTEGLAKLRSIYQKLFPGSTAPDMNELIRQRKVAAEKDAQALANNSSASNRIMMLSGGGQSLQDIIQDQKVRSDLASELGLKADDPRIDQEIKTRFASVLNSNFTSYQTSIENDIGGILANDGTVESALADGKTRRDVAYSLGLDPVDPANKDAIDNKIKTVFEEQNRDPAIRFANDAIKNIVPDEYQNDPNVFGDLKTMYKQLLSQGVIDENGNIKADAVVDWPWQDPDTYLHYTDWNGNDIKYDANGNPIDNSSQVVKVDGKDYTYTSSDGSTKTLTFAEATRVWNDPSKVTKAEREAYFDGGTFNVAKFVSDHFGTTNTPSGSIIPHNPDALDDAFDGDSVMQTEFKTFKENLNMGLEAPAGTIYTQGEPVPAGVYVYYDADGNVQTASVESPNTQRIYQQLSMWFNGGKPLTADEFKNYMRDGSKFRIDSNGVILNFTDDFKPYVNATTGEIDMAKIDASNGPIPESVANAVKPVDSGEFNVSTPDTGTNSSQVRYNPPGRNDGRWYTRLNYNGTLYNGNGTDATFKDDFKTWAEENRGGWITYDGNRYQIPTSGDLFKSLVTIGHAAYDDNMIGRADALVVVAPDGTKIPLTFGVNMDSKATSY